MTNFLSRIIDLLLPPRCICCGKIVSGADGLCAECFNEVSFITKPYCAKCGHPFDEVPDGRQMLCGTCLRKTRTPFRLSRSALRYDEFSKTCFCPSNLWTRPKTPRFCQMAQTGRHRYLQRRRRPDCSRTAAFYAPFEKALQPIGANRTRTWQADRHKSRLYVRHSPPPHQTASAVQRSRPNFQC